MPVMDASLDLNSSDYEGVDDELDAVQRSMFAPNPNIGKRIMDAIIANQATDRPLSKKNSRELQPLHGAPSTQVAQQSVANSWDTFCATIKHEYVLPEAWTLSKLEY
ncbi:hypothetical protein LTR86_004882 [Recurvomyces mirabilis]|nr:hypothetical protein LTR86_004882 [Recurvomyces mirabilis]